MRNVVSWLSQSWSPRRMTGKIGRQNDAEQVKGKRGESIKVFKLNLCYRALVFIDVIFFQSWRENRFLWRTVNPTSYKVADSRERRKERAEALNLFPTIKYHVLLSNMKTQNSERNNIVLSAEFISNLERGEREER